MQVLNNTINFECKRKKKNEYGTQKIWHVIKLLFIILSVSKKKHKTVLFLKYRYLGFILVTEKYCILKTRT